MMTPMALICKVLFPSISTFETPPTVDEAFLHEVLWAYLLDLQALICAMRWRGTRPPSRRAMPSGPQGSWYRRHVERTDKLETRVDKLRWMTQVDAMPCPRHAEHADTGVQTPQAVEVGILEHGPLREVSRHNDSRTAQTSRELVRVEPVPHLPRGKRLKGRRVHVGHVLRTVQGFLWGLPWVDLQQEVGELWNILGDDQVSHPRVLLRSAAESPTAQGWLLKA